MSYPYQLGEAIGIELEYMIVDRDTLEVRPICDELIKSEVGSYEMELERGDIAWSNELVLHVVELKTNGPVSQLSGVWEKFQSNVAHANARLASLNAKLMPTGMHPWMDPYREMRLWPHEDNPIYRAFHRIFDCRGHGWANLQSTHINLSFGDDEQFGRLHAAIRLVLPLLPALSASTPVMDGNITGLLDQRLEVYRHNAQRLPQVTGAVIPERAFNARDYQTMILDPIYAALAPLDPDGTLQYEWANARGAIARFQRGSIEIRVLDIQECPAADLAIAQLVVAAVGALTGEELSPYAHQMEMNEGALWSVMEGTIRDGERTLVTHPAYREHFALAPHQVTAGEVWQHLADRLRVWERLSPPEETALRTILQRGPLARRLVKRLGTDPNRARLAEVYHELTHCLAEGRPFAP